MHWSSSCLHVVVNEVKQKNKPGGITTDDRQPTYSHIRQLKRTHYTQTDHHNFPKIFNFNPISFEKPN